MLPATERRIRAKHPWIASHSDYPKYYHILCGEGWANLIESTLSKVEDRFGYLGHLYIVESMGRLHLEAEEPDEDLVAFFAEVASSSEHICEECGKQGDMRANSYDSLKCLCDSCAADSGYTIKETRLFTKATI